MSVLNIPLRIKDSSGDLQRFTLSEENYLAYQLGVGITESNDSEVSTLTLNPEGATLIGSFTDTFFTNPVGTHPGSSISGPSTTLTNLYQKNGQADSDGSEWRIPVAYSDSDNSYHEMNDSDFDSLLNRLLTTFTVNDYPGTFRLDSDGFNDSDWSIHINNVFSDTQTDGTTINYNIYQRQSITPPAAVRPVSIKRTAGRTGDYDGGLQEFTDEQIKYTFSQKAKTSIASGGVGSYQVRSSAQGAPSSPGNWVSKGLAVDTRKEVTEENFSRSYVGTYVGSFAGDFATNYIGSYTNEYAGQFTNQYTGQYTGDYVGVYGGLVGETYTGNYVGTRFYGGFRNYIGTRSFQFTGTTSQQFTGFYTRQFGGQFSDLQQFTGQFTATYQGLRIYTGLYSNASGTEFFLGFFTGPASYTGTASTQYSGIVQYTGFYGGSIAKSYTGTVSSQYTGVRLVSSTGFNFFSSTQSFSGGFTGTSTRNYTGNFTRQYTGQYSKQYTGVYTRQYVGSYTKQYIGLYSGSYSGLSYVAQYAGQTIQPTSNDIETYTLYVRTA